MSVDDVARALMAMDDEAVRTRVRESGVASLGDLELTDEEGQLLSNAASEPEVAGYVEGGGGVGYYARAMPAYEYVGYNNTYLSPSVRRDFGSYLQNRFGRAGAFAAMRV